VGLNARAIIFSEPCSSALFLGGCAGGHSMQQKCSVLPIWLRWQGILMI